MSILVTGAAGLVGSSIASMLTLQEYDVISIDDLSAGSMTNLEGLLGRQNFTHHTGNILDDELLDKIFRKKITHVFHEAVSKNTRSMLSPSSDLLVNALGTLKLLERARIHNSHFIHASTGSVYGRTSEFPTTEIVSKNPVSFYGNSKNAAENYVNLFHQIYGLHTTVLRYFHVYGWRQDAGSYGGVVPIFINHALRNEPIEITGDGKQIRQFTYVEDIAKINLAFMENKTQSGEVYNCASPEKTSIKNLAEMIIKETKSTSSIKNISERIGDIKNFDVSCEKLNQVIKLHNWTNFTTGLQETIEKINEKMN